jgi:UPF0755 protein
VVDTLVERDLVSPGWAFTLFARARGDDREIRSGRYAFDGSEGWTELLDALTRGRVLTETVTIPEGFTLRQMAPRLARISGDDPDTVAASLGRDSLHHHFDVPGPGLEGYLFPDTYRFAPGTELETVLSTMARRYREVWTPDRRSRLSDLELTEREVVTLASIIQAEARLVEEMPVISSVYHNRLEIGYPLQADPTVLYALGGPRERLLFAAIDSVAENPYNTYRHPGLPPGPIGAPGEAALDAALHPDSTDFLYFVARPTGEHIFTRSLREHNRAVARARRERAAESASGSSGGG